MLCCDWLCACRLVFSRMLVLLLGFGVCLCGVCVVLDGVFCRFLLFAFECDVSVFGCCV